MRIDILGADSFGVRSLATFVRTSKTRILIDPGVSIAPRRDGKPPHKLELEELKSVRDSIQTHARDADAIVITHFHHDHYSSYDKRELDLTNTKIARALYRDTTLYVKSWQRNLNQAQRQRAIEFVRALGRRVSPADGRSFGELSFSPPVKHGEADSEQGWVTMVMIEDKDERMVFASDIQLIESEAIDWIIARSPQTVIVSGPPIYLDVLLGDSRAKAKANLLRLADAVPTVVVDHHLLRTTVYGEFLAESRERAAGKKHRVITAADFMTRPNTLLEAHRKDLWENE
ncbi:MAG: MBL fold metallo-hydrolase [Candidatus Eisenbacteria bacterium]